MFGVALRLALGGLRTWLISDANQADFDERPELCSCNVFGMDPNEFSHVLAEAHIQCSPGQWRTTTIKNEYSRDRRNSKYYSFSLANLHMISVLSAA